MRTSVHAPVPRAEVFWGQVSPPVATSASTPAVCSEVSETPSWYGPVPSTVNWIGAGPVVVVATTGTSVAVGVTLEVVDVVGSADGCGGVDLPPPQAVTSKSATAAAAIVNLVVEFLIPTVQRTRATPYGSPMRIDLHTHSTASD